MTQAEIIRTLSAVCEDIFDKPPETIDLQEGFARPCTYLELLGCSAQGGAGGSDVVERAELRITYFAAANRTGYLELIRAEEKLEDALTMRVRGDSFVLWPEDVSFSVDRDDMALECEFSVTVAQERDIDSGRPYMQTLNHKECE